MKFKMSYVPLTKDVRQVFKVDMSKPSHDFVATQKNESGTECDALMLKDFNANRQSTIMIMDLVTKHKADMCALCEIIQGLKC